MAAPRPGPQRLVLTPIVPDVTQSLESWVAVTLDSSAILVAHLSDVPSDSHDRPSCHHSDTMTGSLGREQSLHTSSSNSGLWASGPTPLPVRLRATLACKGAVRASAPRRAGTVLQHPVGSAAHGAQTPHTRCWARLSQPTNELGRHLGTSDAPHGWFVPGTVMPGKVTVYPRRKKGS